MPCVLKGGTAITLRFNIGKKARELLALARKEPEGPAGRSSLRGDYPSINCTPTNFSPRHTIWQRR